MSIQKINGSQSFCGIKKVVKTVSKNEASRIRKIVNDKLSPSLIEYKHPLLKKITSFFSGEKQIGELSEYVDGSFNGYRDFSGGIKLTYGAHYGLTKKYGKKLFPYANVEGKGVFAPSIPYTPFDKNGKPVIPTLKEIKKYNKPQNILRLIKDGKLKIIEQKK